MQNLEEKLRKTERYTQSHEVEIEQRLRAIVERSQTINLQEDKPRQKSAAFRAREEKPQPREAALRQVEIEELRNGEDGDDDLLSLSVASRTSNTTQHRNYDDPFFKDDYLLKDSGNYGNQG